MPVIFITTALDWVCWNNDVALFETDETIKLFQVQAMEVVECIFPSTFLKDTSIAKCYQLSDPVARVSANSLHVQGVT